MLPAEFDVELGKRVLTMRIIVATLLAGIVGFAVLAVAFRMLGNVQAPPGNMVPMLLVVGLAFTVANAVTYLIVPGKIIKSALRRLVASEPAKAEAVQFAIKLCEVYQTQLIVGAALLEGTAFLWLMFFMLSGEWFMLGFVVAAVVLLGLRFPSADQLARWLDQQQESLEIERANLDFS